MLIRDAVQLFKTYVLSTGLDNGNVTLSVNDVTVCVSRTPRKVRIDVRASSRRWGWAYLGSGEAFTDQLDELCERVIRQVQPRAEGLRLLFDDRDGEIT